MARSLCFLLLLLPACATPLALGDLATLRGVRPHAAPVKEASARIPVALVGDWAVPGDDSRLRFDSGGRLFIVQSLPFTLEGQTLKRGLETYTRVRGTAGLPGVWRAQFPEGEWLEMTLGAAGFYEFAWHDGLRGTGSAIVEGDQLTIVEHRADIACEGTTMQLRPPGAEPYLAQWSVAGDELTLTLADGPHTWRRVLPY
jgi:hypothetical protein